ncbi:uncharacterized protein KY384_004626 [Bacidia gigantensis]|uniref:uncharacterized protein n=1 Tax=Bacidia gigantensis TaxID=2732470 RepID=UPI001D0534B9|nr:uncharacterized protein KY384_004626 [Bacidia gigantensis]KAG8531268.1 hypothetical protein KY384_004626 [Bacidia gigantensis]
MPAEADKARTIYVIARIYKLGQKGMGMELIVDPQTALEQGELHIEPDRYKVTLGKRRLPDDAKRLIPENAFAPSDSTSNFRSTSPEMIATSGREVENDRIMEASPSILTGPSHTQQYSPPRRISGEEQTREKEEEHNMTESTDVHASTLEDSPPLLLPGIESKEKMGGRRSSDDPLQHPGILSTNITSPKPNGSIADGLIEETLHLQDTNSDSGHRDQNNRPFSIFSSAKSAGAGALSIPGSEIQKSPIEWPTSELPKGFRFPADESVPKTSAEDTSKSLDLLKDGAKDAALLYQLSDDPLMTSSSSQFPFAKPHPSQAAFVSETSLSNPQPGNPTFNTATHTQFLSYLEYDNHVDIIRQYQSTGFTPPESFWSFEEIRIGAYNGVTKVDWPLYHEDFQCIGFGPPYEGLSFEEVRLQHYLQAKEPRDYQSDDDNWDAALCEAPQASEEDKAGLHNQPIRVTILEAEIFL